MHTLHVRRLLQSTRFDIPELAPFVGKTVEIIVLAETEASGPERPSRKPGSAAGQIIMSDDFNDPLEDFEPYA